MTFATLAGVHDGEISPTQAEVDTLRKRIEALEALRDEVDRLTDQMLAEMQENRRRHASSPVAWVDLDAARAKAEFADLRAWMSTVLVHHSRVMGALRPCWYRHPAAVQMLLDVRAAWIRGYRGGTQDPSWALDWWQRHLPQFEHAIAAEMGHCTSVRHDPDHVPPPALNEAAVEAYLDVWGLERNSDTRPPSP